MEHAIFPLNRVFAEERLHTAWLTCQENFFALGGRSSSPSQTIEKFAHKNTKGKSYVHQFPPAKKTLCSSILVQDQSVCILFRNTAACGGEFCLHTKFLFADPCWIFVSVRAVSSWDSHLQMQFLTEKTRTSVFCIGVVLALLPLCVGGDFVLRIAHTSDVHSRFEPTDTNGNICDDGEECFGGVARRFAEVQRLRNAGGQNLLFMDSGDQFSGTLWFYLYKGNATAHFMNILGYDVMVSA